MVHSLIIAILVVAALAVAALAGLAYYSVVFPRQPFQGPLPSLTAEERDAAVRLRAHVTAIASKPHNVHFHANLGAAAAYIERTLRSYDLTPRAQVYTVSGREVRNIEVVLEPAAGGTAERGYVIGAHYDSPGDSPGANDNGTGSAAVLELARIFAAEPLPRARLRLVLFVNEEAPYFRTEAMGSWRYARALREAGERVDGMISLETIGYFSDRPGSQLFPWPFNYVYPDIGNFVAFVGLPGSRGFLRRALSAFRDTTAFPAIGGVAPDAVEGIGLSDHWAFAKFGYPGIMVTDTAPFRNPYYHRINDLPQSVDYDSLARVTLGVARMARALD
jgi:Zn-dependent M28 family amino/carboxypeptidase